jgi:hypothetical protein
VYRQFLQDLTAATTAQRVNDIRTLFNGARAGQRISQDQFFDLCRMARECLQDLGVAVPTRGAVTVVLDVEDSPLRCPRCNKRMIVEHESVDTGVELVHVCLGCGHRESDEMLRPAPDMAAAIALAVAETPGHTEPGELP